MSYGSDEEKPDLPPMRPVVRVRQEDGSMEDIYALQPQQNKAYCLTPLERPPGAGYPRHIGYGGAAGGGKSYLARAVAAAAAHKWPGSTSIIFRKTREEVIENHVKPFREEVPEEYYDLNMSRLEIRWKATNSFTKFGFLRRDDDVYKYQGQSYDCMVFEEATHYTWWAVNWLVGNRLRSSVDSSEPFALYPSNPGNVGHFWYKRLFIHRDHRYDPELPREQWEEDPDEYAFTQAYLEDNRVLMVRDPGYIRRLNNLPEPERSWLRDGDWEAGAGLALPQLSRRVHLIDPFEAPKHWPWFGAYDWGYEHPWCFGVFTVDEDGVIYLADSFHGRRDTAPQQAEQIADLLRQKDHIPVGPSDLVTVETGHDTFATHRSRGDDTPHRAEAFQEQGFAVNRANTDRVHGLNTLREYLDWRERGPGGEDGEPALYIMETPGNLRTFSTLETMTTDPDRPEDVEKRDADEFGEGGDDPYDMLRYGVASRPARPEGTFERRELRAWDPEMLEAEADRHRKGGRGKDRRGGGRQKPKHPVFGRAY